ncbi:hypothetical protein GCM10010485_30670 [Streptosporangium carneum]
MHAGALVIEPRKGVIRTADAPAVTTRLGRATGELQVFCKRGGISIDLSRTLSCLEFFPMRTGIRVLLGLTTVAALTFGGSAAASAAALPSIWKWGPVYSTDGHAEARGKVALAQSGFVVYGSLEDTLGSGCSWAQVRALSARGKVSTASYYNCVPGKGTFRKDYGAVLTIKVRACRGTATRPTGRCSRWKTVYTQGG